ESASIAPALPQSLPRSSLGLPRCPTPIGLGRWGKGSNWRISAALGCPRGLLAWGRPAERLPQLCPSRCPALERSRTRCARAFKLGLSAIEQPLCFSPFPQTGTSRLGDAQLSGDLARGHAVVEHLSRFRERHIFQIARGPNSLTIAHL